MAEQDRNLWNAARIREGVALVTTALAREMAGERDAARDAYLAAATRTSNLPQQRYLHARAARLTGNK